METDDDLNTRIEPDLNTIGVQSSLDSAVSSTTGSGTFSVRCPHCSEMQTYSVERKLRTLRCVDCHRGFNLLFDNAEASFTAFDRFKPIDQLGRGGFGVVWKAWDNQLNRIVAIKFPRMASLDEDGIERCMREARAAAGLDHDRIVRVYDVCLCNDAPVLVSQYIDGQPLDELLRNRGTIDPISAAKYAHQIADGLHHAHDHGVIHRDLKPGNVLIDSENQVHITDFGLAKNLSDEVTITRDGQLVGTPAYMAPEQAIGGSEVDRRCDIYALGTILFQLTTGERPFRGTLRMLIRQVIEDAPPPPRKLNAAIPRDLETIICKCLSKRPADRYANAAELRDDLERFLRNEPIRAKPPTPLQIFQRWYPKHASLMLGAYFMVTPMTWVFYIFGDYVQPPPDPAAFKLGSPILLPWAFAWIGLGWCMLKYGRVFEMLNWFFLIPFAILPFFMPNQYRSWGLIGFISLIGLILQIGAMVCEFRQRRIEAI